MSNVIYCISGLGADEKIFSNLQIDKYELKYISWLQPKKGESIAHYAARMGKAINEDNAILMGVSFGGMMGIEIAKQKKLKKLIIVSSIKSISELPGWMKLAGKFKLHKIAPAARSSLLIEKIANSRLGAFTKEEKKIARAYRRTADMAYVNWAIDKVVNWKNKWQPDCIVHIHGDKDKIFPVSKISKRHIIKNGTHFMIYNRADEISKIIIDELKENGA